MVFGSKSFSWAIKREFAMYCRLDWLWRRVIEQGGYHVQSFLLDFAGASTSHRIVVALPLVVLIYYCLSISQVQSGSGR